MSDTARATSEPETPPAVYDATTLGKPRMFVLGIQHMFAMFGATILVPVLTGLSVSDTLLFAGLGTLLFHILAKGKVPAFLGSSFAFIAGYAAIAPNGEAELLPYASYRRRMRRPALPGAFWRSSAHSAPRASCASSARSYGSHYHCIGLILASSAIANCSTNWIGDYRYRNHCGLQYMGARHGEDHPILIGVVVSYAAAAAIGEVDFSGVAEAAWVGLPFSWDNTVFSLFGPGFDAGLAITAIITIMPLAFATMIEHIGDISAISSTCERNFIANPGLHRTLLGDGLATILASLFGAPANTTYGENTGVLALTRVFDARVVRIAACCAIVLSFSPKFAAVIGAMPSCVIGGVSLVLYGMISAVGVRNLVENHVDFQKSRNVLVAAIVLVLSIGIAYSAAGAITFEVSGIVISLSGLAIGSLAGIILNAILPGKDYEFDESDIAEEEHALTLQ